MAIRARRNHRCCDSSLQDAIAMTGPDRKSVKDMEERRNSRPETQQNRLSPEQGAEFFDARQREENGHDNNPDQRGPRLDSFIGPLAPTTIATIPAIATIGYRAGPVGVELSFWSMILGPVVLPRLGY